MYTIIDISQNRVSAVTPTTLTTSFNVTIQNGDNVNTKIQDTAMPSITVARVDGIDTLTTMETASVEQAQLYIDAKYNA